MLPPLEEIAKRRLRLGLSQKQLAKFVGVSQSLIAKIEAGRINPSYLKTKAIFDQLEVLEKRSEAKAKEIYHERVVGVEKDDPISRAIKLMRETGYSQLPVFDAKHVVGSISEKTVLDQTVRGIDIRHLSKMKVESVMEEAFPRVDEQTPLSVVSILLQYSNAVLVTRRGSVAGIITRSDLLKVLRR